MPLEKISISKLDFQSGQKSVSKVDDAADTFENQVRALKANRLVKEFQFEEYGMLFHLIETKPELIKDIISDSRSDDNLDVIWIIVRES